MMSPLLSLWHNAGVLSWIIYYASAATLALIFLLGAVHKLRDRATFARSVVGYELMPVGIALRAADGLVIAELVAVAEIVVTAGASRWMALALLTLYTTAIVINLLRGRADIDCGCGGAKTPLSWWLVARNALLVWFALPQSTAGVILVGTGMLVALMLVVFVTLLAVVCYEALNQLLANRLLQQGHD